MLGGLWAWQHPDSFTRTILRQVRSEWRRAVVYAWPWRRVMLFTELTKCTGHAHPRVHYPTLRRVRADGWRDRISIRLLHGQCAATYAAHAQELANSFGAHSCRVRVDRPRRIWLDLIHTDPLTTPLPAPTLNHRPPRRFPPAHQNGCSMSTTVIDLLDALRDHLAEFELPELYSVHVITASGEPTVSAQLAAHYPPQIATGLLAWADTLTDVTTEAWRVPGGDSVHLSVIGQLPQGLTIRIYGGVPSTPHSIGADLTPNTSTTLPLTCITWPHPAR